MSTVHSLQIIFVEKLLEGNALGPMGLSAVQKVDHENRPHETWEVRRQRSLKLRAHLMQEAIRNHDFTFRLPIDGLLPGERAMQQTLNKHWEQLHTGLLPFSIVRHSVFMDISILFEEMIDFISKISYL